MNEPVTIRPHDGAATIAPLRALLRPTHRIQPRPFRYAMPGAVIDATPDAILALRDCDRGIVAALEENDE